MSRELICILITKMYVKLNKLIEESDYNLMDEKVQKYSRRLDRAIIRYVRPIETNCCKNVTLISR